MSIFLSPFQTLGNLKRSINIFLTMNYFDQELTNFSSYKINGFFLLKEVLSNLILIQFSVVFFILYLFSFFCYKTNS